MKEIKVMTQEEKQLLLKDLCARLPYGVRFRFELSDGSYRTIDLQRDTLINFDEEYCFWILRGDIVPYLRPMSSMSDEEQEALKQEHTKDMQLFAEALTKAAAGDASMRGKVIPHFAADWCNKNHFDYRGLIPMGLALEAPEGMYKIE